MNRSETIGALALALSKAQGMMEAAKKDANNPFFKSKYADLASIVDAIRTPLASNELAYVQTTDIDEFWCVTVETTLIHSSGEWISSPLRMTPTKTDPQGIGSCITYARRYGLQALLGVPTDDDDGNAASGKADQAPAKANGHAPQAQRTPPPAKEQPKPDYQPAPVHTDPDGLPFAPEPEQSIERKQLIDSIQIAVKILAWPPLFFGKEIAKKFNGKATTQELTVEELQHLDKALKAAVDLKAVKTVAPADNTTVTGKELPPEL